MKTRSQGVFNTSFENVQPIVMVFTEKNNNEKNFKKKMKGKKKESHT